MSLFRNFDDDYYIEEASDDDNFLSSEEEEDDVIKFLSSIAETGEFEPLRNAKEEKQDFESEMNSELDKAILNHEAKYNFPSTSKNASQSAKRKAPSADGANKKYYDDDYFDSDSDDDNANADKEKAKKEAKKKRQVLSNDELFYDPDMDDEDQKWVDDLRRAYLPNPPAGQKQKRLPKSDATLSCPACMTVLCLDCQRHEFYSSQFRAMFARNCSIDFAESLHYPEKTKKFKKQKRAAAASVPDPKPSDLYHPVKCSVCKTEVAVYDCEEVYHFFNVLWGT